MCDDLVFGDLVPDRQQDLLVAIGSRHQAVEFVLGPVLVEEGLGQDDEPEAAIGYAAVDAAPEAVADPEFELVVPDADASLS